MNDITVPAKNNKKWYFLGISLVLALLLIWGFWPRTTCITFLRAGKPIPDLTLDIIIADDSELNDKVFKTNHLGQIFIPRPSKRCSAVTRIKFSNGKTDNPVLIFRPGQWMSYNYGPNFDNDMKFTTKYPGFFPWQTKTHIQSNIPDNKVKKEKPDPQ